MYTVCGGSSSADPVRFESTHALQLDEEIPAASNGKDRVVVSSGIQFAGSVDHAAALPVCQKFRLEAP